MKKQIFTSVVAFLAIFAILSSPVSVFSAEEEKAKPRLHPGISNQKKNVTNSSFDQFDITPGETVTKSFKFYNLGSEDFKVTLTAVPYSVIDEEYNSDQITQSIRTALSKWITFPRNNFIMEAGSEETIEYVVAVPSNAIGGPQRAQIGVNASLMDDGEEVSGIQISSVAIGYTVLTYVQDGNTPKIDMEVIQQDIPFFYLGGNIGSIVRIKNSGNVDVPIRHQTVIHSFFGDNLAYDSKLTDAFIYADTTRLIEIRWPETPMLGIFKVKSTVWIGDDVYEKEGIAIILPIFIIIILLLVISLLVVSTVMRHKKQSSDRVRINSARDF